MSQPLRIVHIGAGPFSRANHCPCLQRLAAGPEPRISMEAICDLDIEKAEAFHEDFGYKAVYTDFAEMIETVQPDRIYSMVAPQFTAGVLERVLTYGIPTFTEKQACAACRRVQRDLLCRLQPAARARPRAIEGVDRGEWPGAVHPGGDGAQ